MLCVLGPKEEIGFSCVDGCDSMISGNGRSPGPYIQFDRWCVDGILMRAWPRLPNPSKDFQTQEMNRGPWTDTISSGIPKLRNKCWNKAFAISVAEGRLLRRIRWQALVNLSTVMRMQVWLSDGGRSVIKSIWCMTMVAWEMGVEPLFLQSNDGVSQPLTNWTASLVIPGHQYRWRRSERVCCLPGCIEPGEECHESIRVIHKVDVM